MSVIEAGSLKLTTLVHCLPSMVEQGSLFVEQAALHLQSPHTWYITVLQVVLVTTSAAETQLDCLTAMLTLSCVDSVS